MLKRLETFPFFLFLAFAMASFFAPFQAHAFQETADAAPLCGSQLKVCGHSVKPPARDLGSSFNVRVAPAFKAAYICDQIGGQPVWVPVFEQGSCDAYPVILLPTRYDESSHIG